MEQRNSKEHPNESPKFQKGDRVHLSSDLSSVGIIFDGPQTRRGDFYYRVFFSGDKRDTLFQENALEPHLEPEDFATAFSHTDFLNRKDFLNFLILEKIRQPLSDNLIYILFLTHRLPGSPVQTCPQIHSFCRSAPVPRRRSWPWQDNRSRDYPY